jgi:hypothetical protein
MKVAGGGRKEGSTAKQLRAGHGHGVRLGALESKAWWRGIERPGASNAEKWSNGVENGEYRRKLCGLLIFIGMTGLFFFITA